MTVEVPETLHRSTGSKLSISAGKEGCDSRQEVMRGNQLVQKGGGYLIVNVWVVLVGHISLVVCLPLFTFDCFDHGDYIQQK